MPQQESGEALPPAPGPLQAGIIMLALVPLIGAYVAFGMLLGFSSFMFVGWAFVTYWLGIMQMKMSAFLPSLVGGLGGIALALVIHDLPIAFGTAGIVVAALGLLFAVYSMIRQVRQMLFNNSFMLLLTITATPFFHSDADYAAAAMALVVAAAYCGGLVSLFAWFTRRRALTPSPQN